MSGVLHHPVHLTDRIIPDEAGLLLGYARHTAESYKRRLVLTSAMATAVNLPTAPATFDFRGPVLPQGYDNYWNDVEGDCYEAWMLHTVQIQSNYAGRLIYPDHLCGQIAYEECTGYKPPGVGPGTNPIQGLDYWKGKGIPTKTYQPTQIVNNFSGTITNNVLATAAPPPNPITVGQPLSGATIPNGVTIKSVNADGTFALSVPNSVVLNVPTEAMSTKIAPAPIVQGRDKIVEGMFLDPTNKQLFLDAMNGFITAGGTFALPKAWQNSATWDGPPPGVSGGIWTPGSWGYHQALLTSRIVMNGVTGFLVLTWGNWKFLTDAGAFYMNGTAPSIFGPPNQFMMEGTVVLSSNILNQQTLLAPNGLDVNALKAIITANGGPVP